MTYRTGSAVLLSADDPDPSIRGLAALRYPWGEVLIGGPDELRTIISDLQRLASKMSPHSFDDPIWKEVATDADVDSYERDRCPCSTCIQKASLINRIRNDNRRLVTIQSAVASFYLHELEAYEALRIVRDTLANTTIGSVGGVAVIAGEDIKPGDALVIRDGKAYRA